MSTKARIMAVTLGVIVALAVLITAFRGFAEQPEAAKEAGRYSVAAAHSGASTNIIVCDTKTGQCWEWLQPSGGKGHWTDRGTPIKTK